MARRKQMKIRNNYLWSALFAASLIGMLGSEAFAQSTRRTGSTGRPVATPTPTRAEPEVISRADQYIDENGRLITPVVETQPDGPPPTAERREALIAELEVRIRQLEAAGKDDKDATQRRLALNLDILTKSEQRVESLRKQYFEMVEKEGEIQQRLDTLELELRPESIDKNIAFVGTLRPELLREARQKNLTAERTKLQTLLSEVQRNKANIESNVLRADQLVERLRTRLEKEIDEVLGDGTEN